MSLSWRLPLRIPRTDVLLSARRFSAPNIASQDANLGTELVLLVATLSCWHTVGTDTWHSIMVEVWMATHVSFVSTVVSVCCFWHTPLKINGWFTSKSPNWKGTSCEPNLHDFRFQPLIFQGCSVVLWNQRLPGQGPSVWWHQHRFSRIFPARPVGAWIDGKMQNDRNSWTEGGTPTSYLILAKSQPPVWDELQETPRDWNNGICILHLG